jgi:hypothetical protein
VDGLPDAQPLGHLFATALVLPPCEVTTETSTAAEPQASQDAKVSIDVQCLGSGGSLRYRLNIDFRQVAVDFCCDPPDRHES